jgi:hypothetical protein
MVTLTRAKQYNGLFLLAQTPRAGKYNHRLIAPPNLEAALIRHVSAAPEQYGLVVRREVAQTSGRKGEEWLALIGVNVAQLSASQQANLEKKLTDTLEIRFENWRKTQQWSGSSDIVRLETMHDWLKDLQKALGNFPKQTIDYEEKAEKTPWLLPVVAVASLVVAVSIFYFTGQEKAPDSTANVSANATSTPQQNPEVNNAKRAKLEKEKAALEVRHKALRQSSNGLQFLQALENPEGAFHQAVEIFEKDLGAWSESLQKGETPAKALKEIQNAMRTAHSDYKKAQSAQKTLAEQQQAWLNQLKNALQYPATADFNDPKSLAAVTKWLEDEQQKTASQLAERAQAIEKIQAEKSLSTALEE